MTLMLIDANSLIYRCFYALPPFTNKEKFPTGALYGLSNIFLKILKENRPDFIAALFDRPEPTFRKKIFDEYKIHRPKAPDELILQIKEAHNLFELFGIKTYEKIGFEGDDLIGTAVEKFKNVPDLKIIILTGDMDNLQLIDNEKILVETFKKGVSETIIYDEKAVIERYGVLPSQLPEYKALVGDQSDNIPGAPGIGPKTASEIIKKYGSVKNFFEKGVEEKNYQKIFPFKEQVFLSLNLATIRRDAPIEINLEELRHKEAAQKTLVAYFKKMGFKAFIKRLEQNNKLF